MQLSTFYSDISQIIKRGSSLDGVIPGATRRAVKAIERRLTFDFMKDYYRETLAADASAIQNWASIDKNRIKSIKSVRLVGDDDSSYWLKKDDERYVPTREIGIPTTYWLSAIKEVHFDTIADRAYTVEFRLAAYTAWPTQLSAEPAILMNHEDLVLYRTMVELAPVMRDPGMISLYKGLYDDAIASAAEAEVDQEEDNTDHNMNYGEIW